MHRQAPDLMVWAVGTPGAPPRGTLDPDLLIWCEPDGFTLITNDRASMPVHLPAHMGEGGHSAGIFILNPKMSLAETVAELILIASASDPSEYVDRITYLPESS